MRTGYSLISQAAERTPDRVAIVDDRTDRKLTYREMMKEVKIIAAGMFARGVRPGDRIATALPNVVEHCLALLALQLLAAVPVVMNFRLPGAQLAALVSAGNVKGAIILGDPAVANALYAVLPADSLLLSVDGEAGAAKPFSLCRADVASLPLIPEPDPEDTAFILYTSGTTGLPKGVMFPHRTTEYRMTTISPITGLRAGEQLRALGAAPLFHGIGLYSVFMTTLMYNGTYFLMSGFSPAAALDMIERNRITFIFAVPTILQAMIAAPSYRPARVASLELVLFGGAAMPGALLEQLCSEWNAHLQHLYGTTEAYIPLCNASPRGNPATLQTVFPHSARLVKVGGCIDDAILPGETGELTLDVSNDCFFSGYLNDPEATAAKIRDGWYFTGDVFRLGATNDFDFVGRVDDAIRSGGETIYPAEIEEVIAAHPDIDEACVIGLPDRYWGEQVVACVVSKDRKLDPSDIDKHCRSAVLAKFKRPRRYVVVDALPRNASNKILRKTLRDQIISQDERLSA